MIDLQILILFAGTCLVLAMIPGPDNLFVSAQSLSHGRRAGLAAASGILLGGVLWTVAATLGLTAILAKLPVVFVGIQVLGAGYLLFLAISLWKNANNPSGQPPDVAHAFVRGLTTNLLNPKVGLYYLSLIPQFISDTAGPVWQQMLILGAIFNVVGGFVMYGIALIAGTLQMRMQEKPAAGMWLGRLGALIMIGIAAKLIWGLLL